MLVGIELSAALRGRCSGVGNYIAHLTGELRKLEARSELDLLYFSNYCDYAGAGAKISGVGPGMVYEQDRLPVRLAWMQLGLARSLARTRPDLCHFPNYLAPVVRPPAVPYLATMYDMSVYRYPQYHPLKTTLVHRAIMPVVAQQARQIITVSESARQDILHYLKAPLERVRVVYGGVGEDFLSGPEPGEEAQIRARYSLDFPYILMVGTLEPRKNHARLIQAFSQLVQQERLPHHLVLVGAHGWKEGDLNAQVLKSDLNARLHFLGYVPDADLPALYRSAAAFCFPSLHEGFGLPVLEALAAGTPTLISNDQALLEVSGPEVAVVVDPLSVEDIATGLYRLLTDAPLAETLRTRGLLHARQFSWARCAAQTLDIYREVAAEKSALAFTVPAPRPVITSPADSSLEPAPTYRIAWSDEPVTELKPPSAFERIPPTVALSLAPADTRPSPLEQAILETVLYSDIFTFALNTVEIQRYLIGQTASLSEVEQALENSAYLAQRLERREDYFYLRGRAAAFEQRQASDRQIEQSWRRAQRWAGWLQAIPFLRTALVTGSLAAGSARPRDDLDLLLITAPGRLWTCRAFVIGLVYLARLGGVELCPNYLLAETPPALTLTERNLYTAREFAQMRLLFGRASYDRLLALNRDWVGDTFPNSLAYLAAQAPLVASDAPGYIQKWLKQTGERLLGGKMGQKLETWEQNRKIARLRRQDGAETRFSAEVCKGHFGNYARQTLKRFADRCRLYHAPQESPTVQEVL